MRITEFQNIIVSAIHKALPNIKQCEIYGGQFDGEHGQRVAIHAPAVFVAARSTLAISDPGITGQMDINLELSAFIIAQYANDRIRREGGCMDLAESVALLIHNNNFNQAFVGEAKVKRMQSKTNATVDSAGFAIWSVDWVQSMRIGSNPVQQFGTLQSVNVSRAPNVGSGATGYTPV